MRLVIHEDISCTRAHKQHTMKDIYMSKNTSTGVPDILSTGKVFRRGATAPHVLIIGPKAAK